MDFQVIISIHLQHLNSQYQQLTHLLTKIASILPVLAWIWWIGTEKWWQVLLQASNFGQTFGRHGHHEVSIEWIKIGRRVTQYEEQGIPDQLESSGQPLHLTDIQILNPYILDGS